MRHAVLSLILASTIAVPATAQANPQTRQGFWIGFGFGAGSLSLECENCDEREAGVNFFLRMGGTLSQRLLIGGEVNGWTKTENDVTLTVRNVGPVVMFYPSASGGFFLKGGVGLASSQFDLRRITIEDTGAGLTLGLGYDARVGRNFALTPYFDILTASFDSGNVNQVAFGLGFTWP